MPNYNTFFNINPTQVANEVRKIKKETREYDPYGIALVDK